MSKLPLHDHRNSYYLKKESKPDYGSACLVIAFLIALICFLMTTCSSAIPNDQKTADKLYNAAQENAIKELREGVK